MIELDNFRKEHTELRDLCSILDATIGDYSLRDNMIMCELIERFVDEVNAHLKHEDRSVYRDLLKQHSKEADQVADRFLGNTQEIKRIFKEYSRDWCRKPHSENQHEKYIEESRHMFKVVCDRIDFEEQKIFPYLEQRV